MLHGAKPWKAQPASLLTDPDDEAAEQASDASDVLRNELVADCWTPADVAQRPLRDISKVVIKT